MNPFSVPAAGKVNPFLESTAAPANQASHLWRRRGVFFFITMFVMMLLTPGVMAWAGNAWIDEGKLAAVVNPAQGTYVRLDEMPDYLWQSFVAIEDHRFMKHGGVDPVALARAVWIDIQAGEYVQGGSTITMQLARNLFLTQDKTMLRKMKEMAMALQLEQRYSKKELLEMYLNVIYFGHGRYGIGEAAELYFGKKAHGVSLGEAAILASLPKAPESYSPLKHWDQAKKRQSLVLGRMEELGVINQLERKQAQTEKVAVVRSVVRPAS